MNSRSYPFAIVVLIIVSFVTGVGQSKKSSNRSGTSARQQPQIDAQIKRVDFVTRKYSVAELPSSKDIEVLTDEGSFAIKDVSIKVEDDGVWLRARITNNTAVRWQQATFGVILYDLEGTNITPQVLPIFSMYDFGKGQIKSTDRINGAVNLIRKTDLKGVLNSVSFTFSTGSYPLTFSMITPKSSSPLVFEDAAIRIAFMITPKGVFFTLQNKASVPIEIDWGTVSYVDFEGTAHRVMHSGTRYMERDKPQAPTVIPPAAKIEDGLFPTDYVSYESASSGGWRENSLYLDKARARDFLGKSISVFMPLKFDGPVKKYTFRFKVAATDALSALTGTGSL